MTPAVSVVVPVYRAAATLGAALASVAACGLPSDAVEVVIAPDDGGNYSAFSAGFGQRLILPAGPVASGAGPARNRALAAANGAFVAFLDADDEWEAGYLATLLPLAGRHGAAFGQSVVLDAGREILRVPDGPLLTFAAMARSGASFHAVLRRDLAGPFVNLAAQDVLHSVEALALAGGRAPVGAAAYRIALRAGSETARRDFPARVDAAYTAHERAILDGRSRVPAALRQDAAAVFAAKARLNADHARAGRGESFYAFMAARLAGPDQVSGGTRPRPRR